VSRFQALTADHGMKPTLLLENLSCLSR